MDCHKLMPKEEKDLELLLIAEKLFSRVSRSRMAGSISPVQHGLLRKETFEISKRRFCMERCAENKKQSEGLFSSTLTPHLAAGRSPCVSQSMRNSRNPCCSLRAVGHCGRAAACTAFLCRWKLVLPYRGVLLLNC